jgi:membrane associated rhomboid family serine protease
MIGKFWGKSYTNKVIVFMVAIFIFQNYIAPSIMPSFVSDFYLISGGNGINGVFTGEIYRVITSVFMHGGVIHLAFNMLAYYFMGNIVEGYFSRYYYFLILFVVSVGASLISILSNPTNTPAIGASGMIYGLFGVIVIFANELGVELKNFAGIIIVNLGLSFAIPGIDWHAHVGGVVTGILLSLVIKNLVRR